VTAYYNEIDPYAAQWLRNLIAAGLIAPGDVDERSIVDVQPDDLRGYTQCHFFAGIGGWSLAFRLAGWPDDRPAWSGSAPCQPFSVASVNPLTAARGQADERHLAPELVRLAGECGAPVLFGEQVSNAIKWGWLDETFGALEALGYACAATVLPALAVGARHERKRIYWVADASGEGRPGHQPVECVSVAAPTPLSVYGDPLARARRALDGDLDSLLHSDGLSVVLERAALKGYGNAIVPPLAAEFIGAYLDAVEGARADQPERVRLMGVFA
jgi:DNA (cytosine-5)-methyltransferase 1